MRSGIFGWSLPPGVTMNDIDPPERPCDVCGRDPSGDCLCPECPTCGESGNPKCYEQHGLVRTPEQIASRKAYDDACAAEVAAEPDWAEWEREQQLTADDLDRLDSAAVAAPAPAAEGAGE